MRFKTVISVLAATILVAVAAAPAAAVEDRAFTPRFAANQRGDITQAANTLMTCDLAQANCAAARGGSATGAAANNNAYVMQWVDSDADATTFNSSSSALSLPAGAEVLFAGLYFGARTSQGANIGGSGAPLPVPAPSAAARSLALLRGPADAGYAPVAGAADDSSGVPGSFAALADVTARVRAQGAGTYTVANVQAGTGVDRYAGWALVVAYRLASDPPRNLSVFDGLNSVETTDPRQDTTVSGFQTPLAGPVRSRVGVVAYEGDRGQAGVPLILAGRQVTDAANPANNVFNSTIATDGVSTVGRTPDYPNPLGFDADLIRADGFLANGATSALITQTTSLEQYLTQVLTLSTALEPSFFEPPPPPAPPAAPPAVPAQLAVDTTPPSAPLTDGRDAQYVVDVTNRSSAAVTGAQVEYRFYGPVDVRSARVDGGTCTATSSTVRCRLGPLVPGASARVRIGVRPTDTGRVRRSLRVSGPGAVALTRSVTTNVRAGRAALALRKTAGMRRARPGQEVAYRIALRATSRARARGVVVCDRPPRGLRLVSAPGGRRRGNLACWSVAELPSGAGRTFTARARVTANRTVTLANRAVARSTNARSRAAAARVRVVPLGGGPCAGAAGRARAAC